MLFVIPKDLAYELAAVADAASADVQRPILGTIKLEAERDREAGYVTLTAVATDSYRLARREAKIRIEDTVDGDADAALFDHEKGNLLVPAKEWKRQLKAVADAAKVGNVLVDVTPTSITFATEIGGTPEVSVPIQDNLGTFPKYRTLIGPVCAEIEGKLPAFNAVLLASIATIISARPSDRDKSPVLMRATSPSENTELKPWLFLRNSQWSSLEVLLMPHRV